MVSSAARRIKLSKNLKPFVSRVVRAGRVQLAFAEQIGRPVGGCVASRVRAGMSGAEIHKIAADCAKPVRGTRLALGVTRRAVVPAGDSVSIKDAVDLNVLDTIEMDLENII